MLLFACLACCYQSLAVSIDDRCKILARILTNPYNFDIIIMHYAPVAQWIEHRPPEPVAEVRFLSGVPLVNKHSPRLLGVLFLSVNIEKKGDNSSLNYFIGTRMIASARQRIDFAASSRVEFSVPTSNSRAVG